MSFQIYSAIWPYILRWCALKMLWIFLFVTVFISTFLMIMYKSRKEVLKKTVLIPDSRESSGPQNIHGKIQDLKQELKTKEAKDSKKSKSVRKTVLTANKSLPLQNLQKKLITELKRDVNKTEKELAELETEIVLLSRKRESIKSDMSKVSVQQQEYNQCMKVFFSESKKYASTDDDVQVIHCFPQNCPGT